MRDELALLWYSDNPKLDLADKVRAAAARYKKKHGRKPNVCYVHPSALGSDGNSKVKKVGNVRVEPKHNVLAHHFWTGREEPEEPPAPPLGPPATAMVQRMRQGELGLFPLTGE